MMMIKWFMLLFTGFAGGLAVGCGFVAFLSVLGIIPRLMQLTKTIKWIRLYEWAVILGAVSGGWFSLSPVYLHASHYWFIPIGLLYGIFVGMFAAALTEVLNVFPILAKRIGIDDKIVMLMMAIVLGKICGSLFHWLYFAGL
ncbi:MAG: stage V sporulation protein AB [Bacillaceae bacterium]|nr:MAG: stage V sporulation protein AB [Bacillaceae bacterium]